MIKEISANARVSFKQITQSGDVYHTYEYGEVRTVEGDIEKERQELWNDISLEIDKQIIETKNTYKPKQ